MPDVPEKTAPADPASADAPAKAAASAGGIKPWLPLLITVVAMPLLAYAMTSFVLLPHLQKGLGLTPIPVAAKSAPSKSDPNAKKETVVMNKLLVNVAGTMGSRYLLVSLAVVGSDEDFKNKMEAHDAELRDMACGALATKTLADLEKAGARNLIRTELISGFNKILGAPAVQEIFLTEFAIQ